MQKIILIISLCLLFISCTKEKTDYEAEIGTEQPGQLEFKEAYSFEKNGLKVSVQALNGTLTKGYNELRLKVYNKENNAEINSAALGFLPILNDAQGNQVSCPHRYQLVYNSAEKFYAAYAVFTELSSSENKWDLYLRLKVGNQEVLIKEPIMVKEQTNKNLNMVSFFGNDDEQYFIALLGPRAPKVAENNLQAGIYKYNKPSTPANGTFPDPSQFNYSEVKGFTLKLDPRMPEPSMGNHSSPNNKDLVQGDDGFYHGVVNYTMTGNWTLNFIFMNQNGKILKGTEVPKDFTPGVEGKKSELFIDILF
ncbi:hypothetical protein SMI01S_37620 [Sphingobacterium mizutaii NBRC 14946 = DSM 11724]|uniref:YtkA-like n=2 Tax=Sphingobacterium mizutaii TaxID=1010 RepID=A0AAJ5C013_9SPHI|nr:hypothetical protein [Sphingobacterium mizutaii]GEM70156.1 hypothetical protein SMI01S_37620 [Sphingobacterium mizutaii NBRC 14946 = DSM 11724]SDK98788.1 hypothetical protein SAMN05192578_101689 [Sphingobacterium mizutaii]SNV49527.1 Uncharacterised protein [Sphingobacterium mizutaii]